jgi:outer membrane protein OmpA-like peptidoglycan-associated protein
MRKRLAGLLLFLMVVTAVGADTLLAVGSKRIVLNHFIADPKQVSVIYVTDASGSGADITATFYSTEGDIIGQKKTAVAANGTVSLIPMDIVKRVAYGRVVIESTGGKIIGEYWQIVEVEDAKYSIAVPAQPAIGRDKLVVQHFASDPNVTSVIYLSESKGEGSVPVQIEFFDQSSNLLSKVSKTIPVNGTIALKPYDVLQRKIVGSAYITTEGGPIIGEYWQVVNGKFPDPISGKEKKTNYGVAVPLQGMIVTPLSVIETPTEIRLTMEVHFDVDKADVREVDKANLAEAAKVIKRYFSDGDVVMVEGHTDESGEADYNLKLSQKRADNVKSFLVQQYGLKDSQLKAVGYGETRPVVPGATGDAGQVNRRVVFTIPKT